MYNKFEVWSYWGKDGLSDFYVYDFGKMGCFFIRGKCVSVLD